MGIEYASHAGLGPGESVTFLDLRPAGGQAIVIDALYLNWNEDVENILIQDHGIAYGPFQHDMGTPDQPQRLDNAFFCSKNFAIRSINNSSTDEFNAEAIVIYHEAHTPSALTPTRINVKANKKLRRRYMRG